jgi:uroporphyrinogen decarboxylase
MNDALIKAAFGRKTPFTPVWYMRQAGRYLPEYRKLKGDKNILEIVKTPELAAKISLSPKDILGVDAAILYADIMVPLLGIGVDLEIVENIGPVIHKPVKSLKDIKNLKELNPEEDIPYLLDTIQILKKLLKNKVPLIGFSAAPFTLASYLIEGKPTRDFLKTKSLMYQNKKGWEILMEKLTSLIITYLKAQKDAGVEVVQLFDSWVGCLSESDYREYVLPYSRRIFSKLHDGRIPLIHFGTNIASFLEAFASVECDVIGLDWRISVKNGWKRVGLEKSVQGNLDPALMLADFSVIKKKVDVIFAELPKREGHIFNLGHGVLPNTPVENLIRLTEYVHSK